MYIDNSAWEGSSHLVYPAAEQNHKMHIHKFPFFGGLAIGPRLNKKPSFAMLSTAKVARLGKGQFKLAHVREMM